MNDADDRWMWWEIQRALGGIARELARAVEACDSLDVNGSWASVARPHVVGAIASAEILRDTLGREDGQEHNVPLGRELLAQILGGLGAARDVIDVGERERCCDRPTRNLVGNLLRNLQEPTNELSEAFLPPLPIGLTREELLSATRIVLKEIVDARAADLHSAKAAAWRFPLRARPEVRADPDIAEVLGLVSAIRLTVSVTDRSAERPILASIGESVRRMAAAALELVDRAEKKEET